MGVSVISTKDLADRAGISRQHLTSLARQGEVPGAHKKSGRWMYPDTPELRSWADELGRANQAGASGWEEHLEQAREGLAKLAQDQPLIKLEPADLAKAQAEVKALAEAFEGMQARFSDRPDPAEKPARKPVAGFGDGGLADEGPQPAHQAQQAAAGTTSFAPSASPPIRRAPSHRQITEDLDPIERGRRLGRMGVMLYALPLVAVLLAKVVTSLAFGGDQAVGGGEGPSAGGGQWVVSIATFTGILPGLAGAVMMMVALHQYGVRNRWLFWWAIALSVIWGVLLFPGGIIVGVLVLSTFLWQLHIFFPPD